KAGVWHLQGAFGEDLAGTERTLWKTQGQAVLRPYIFAATLGCRCSAVRRGGGRCVALCCSRVGIAGGQGPLDTLCQRGRDRRLGRDAVTAPLCTHWRRTY